MTSQTANHLSAHRTVLSSNHTVANSVSDGFRSLAARYRELYLASTSRPLAPHPGDVLYWVGCVGAVSALLFFAIR